jgi:hypothetical protein
MTRILLTLTLVFCISFIALAQFKKNDILIGGQLSYSYNSSNQKDLSNNEYDQKMNYGNITISVGKALNENSLVGINLSYLPSSSNNYQTLGGPLQYQNNGYAVGVFYRKYKSLGKEFYLFGQVAASYNWSDESGKDSTGNKVLAGSGWSAGINLFPGIAYRISKHFFLELSIPDLFVARYYKSSSVDQPSTAENDQLTVSTGLSSNPLDALGIGFRLIL